MRGVEVLEVLRQNGLRPPKRLTIAITGACNLTCCHCWVGAGGASAAAHVPEPALRRMIEEFVDLEGEGVRFTGGEPLAHPAWFRLLQFSRSLGLAEVSIQTNGMLFTADTVASLAELAFPRLSLQISLDGATAATHDLVRGEGAFAGAMAALRLLARAGLAQQVTIFFTEMRHNLAEIPALLQLAMEQGLGAVVTGSLVLCGRAAEDAIVAPPELDQYHQLLQRFDEAPGLRELYEKIGNVAAIEWRRESAPRTECCTFVENPYLTPNGVLYPCVMCHADTYAVAGVFGKGLVTAFGEGAPLWAALLQTSQCRAEANQACQDCPGRLVCAGGCMGRAWGSQGDLLAADDRCQLRRSVYQKNKSLKPAG